MAQLLQLLLDGSKDVVKVTVEVVEPPKETPVTKPVSESVDPQAKENLQVGLGKTLEPIQFAVQSYFNCWTNCWRQRFGVRSHFHWDFNYIFGTISWKTSVDTTKAGHQTGELEVTYPDGSKEVVEVPVKVGTDAEALTPTVRSDLEAQYLFYCQLTIQCHF